MQSDYFTTSDNVKIHYLTQGSEGSWVVLIHGFTDSAQRMWFRNGFADALSSNHRVVAIDNRNHGQSDKPDPNAPGRFEDTVELMQHLGIERAHIHGYSMGGGITGRILARHPEFFITAGLGGSGIGEVDPELRAAAERFDPKGPQPEGAEASAFRMLRSRAARAAGQTGGDADSEAAAERRRAARPPLQIDLTAIDVPVLCVNGEYDRPYSKSQRLWREVKTFQNVVLPGCNHMSAIGVGRPIPELYVKAMTGFINTYDER